MTMRKKVRQVKHLPSVKRSEMFSMKISFINQSLTSRGRLFKALVNFNWPRNSLGTGIIHKARSYKEVYIQPPRQSLQP